MERGTGSVRERQLLSAATTQTLARDFFATHRAVSRLQPHQDCARAACTIGIAADVNKPPVLKSRLCRLVGVHEPVFGRRQKIVVERSECDALVLGDPLHQKTLLDSDFPHKARRCAAKDFLSIAKLVTCLLRVGTNEAPGLRLDDRD